MASTVPRSGRKRPLGHTLIAFGKLVKVVVLVTVGLVALKLIAIGESPPEWLVHWANVFRVDPENQHLHRLIVKVAGVDTRKLEELGFGTFFYAGLFSIEGIGLWLQKRWAEYFTIAITATFIPLEIYETIHRPGAPKIVTLILNAAVLVYLVARVRRQRREGGSSPARSSRDDSSDRQPA